jgi:large subunit ribosomal protein L7/L12
MIQQGNKIKAIKKLREARNLSLKEAKDYVDALDRTSS